MRQAYYDVTEDKPFPVETLRIFEAGNILEDYWVEILRKNPDIYVLGTQVPAYHVVGDLIIHGRVDVLTQHNKNRIVAHEVKTASSCHWMKEPKPEHNEQLQFYLYCLELEHGVIDYLDKGALLRGGTEVDLSFPIELDRKIGKELISRALNLKSCVDKKTLPVSNSDAWGGKVCGYCLYKDLCDSSR